MSLLFAKHPIVINPDLAEAIGLNEAIVLQQLHYWMNDTTSGVMHEGRKWVYNTHKGWQEDSFKFYSVATIKRTFASLKSMKLIEIERLSDDPRDRTNFYTINYEHQVISGEVNLTSCTSSNCADAQGQPEPTQEVKVTWRKRSKCALLPTETTTETTTENKQISSSENSGESPDTGKIARFLSRHPEAEIYTPSGKSWGTRADLDCASWLWERVQKVNPTQKKPKWVEWANDIRLLREIDGRTHKEICLLFKHANQDSFWRKNILCPSTLREKWDRLTAKFYAGEPHADTSGESNAERQAREALDRWEKGDGQTVVGGHGEDLRPAVDCEEWQRTGSALDDSDWEFDQRPDDERLQCLNAPVQRG